MDKMPSQAFGSSSESRATGTTSKEDYSREQRPTSEDARFGVQVPQITLPKGGGAIKGIGEKFAANPLTGTASMTIPLFTSPGRSGFGPQLSLSYDSGAGNGPFGFGWTLSTPAITRRTDKGLPKYFDEEESDIFILSGAEDLVPVLVNGKNGWERQVFDSPASEPGYAVRRYRPRVEGLFARIERWMDKATGISHWRSISKDNITTLYGKRDDARIADPIDPTHIFTWLICESRDDKGNAILYGYKPEDDANVERTAPYEANRLISGHFAQRYLKNVRYGNRTPVQADEDLTLRDDWLFEVVFDYGEHDETAPTTQELHTWAVRQDPFSLFRATFDVRTYRLCRRVLMFHHFPEELNGTVDYLVRSTDFEYKEGSVASFIASISQAGYAQHTDGTYHKKALPKLEFRYTEVKVDETVHEIDPESIRNLPYGVDGIRYQWVDLDGEGLTGVLTEQADAWYYKRNLGDGTFGPLEQIVPKPSLAALSSGRQQLLDLAGEGHLDLVQYDRPMAGFYERRPEGSWENFTPFKFVPDVNVRDPDLRFVDVTGDGHPDILISEDTVFTWYESQAKNGFLAAERSPKSWDEEKGPQLVFSDPTESIFLADMVGDGLSDIVRIRYSEVCYWPNLGYGRFGAKVTMGNPPLFESPDMFDPKRVHLADIDGSGNSDVVYIGHKEIALYFNQSGNFWSPAQPLSHFPRADNLSAIAVTDLLGNGTACLVWSTQLASEVRQPMRYIDLMGGQKPHLLVQTTNNMGAETEVQYKASTKFYQQDREEGRPWATKLPFPVHVVARVQARDQVSGTELVSTYRYRHGYFDGVEREFRGFAHVEQRDAETVVGQFDLPPIVTKTWFHTGAFLEGDKLEAYFKNPDNHEYFNGDPDAAFLPDTQLPPGLTADEAREACRALKGSILRQEVYADDGTAKAHLPYTVSERSYRLRQLQPRGPNRHAVFFSHAGETIDYHYERNPKDPRISHSLTLAVDDYGNVLQSVAIGYPRRAPAFEEQGTPLATLTESQYTNPVLEEDAYRTPLPAEVKTFELTAPSLTGAKPLDFSIVEGLAATASEIVYEAQLASGQIQKRLIEQLRTLYRKDDLSALLPSGKMESMALPGESYKLAFTPGLLDIFQIKASRAEVTAILMGIEGGYRDLDKNGMLWIPSGQAFYSPVADDSPQQELAFARKHFFLPHRFADPFGNHTIVAYDAKYNLLIISTRDAVANEVKADPDYRILQPKRITDPNDNRSEARFDALGMVVGTAVMGKAVGPMEGDTFDTFVADLSDEEIKTFFDAPDPRSLAIGHLGSATTRIIYDLERVPPCAASIARETHVSDLPLGEQIKVQLAFVYSDGFGREAQTKVQAEPGPSDPNDPNSPVLDPRWVGTGAKLYNNKGKPVRQYEAFFSPTHAFGIEQWGVSSALFYDPIERVVATLHPNHTFEKVVFDPWQQIMYDVNDTVTFDPKTDPDVCEFFTTLADKDYLPTWYQQRIGGAKGADEKSAAEKAAIHSNTPSTAHLDTLGRTFLTIADNGEDADGNEQKYQTRTILDIEGNQREVVDAKNRAVMRYDYDMLSTQIHSSSMEAGARWMLNDSVGKPIRAWDTRGHSFRTEYDSLRRPIRQLVRGADSSNSDARTLNRDVCFEKIEYGEDQMNDKVLNLRTQMFKHYDTAGLVTSVGENPTTHQYEAYDFKGNLLRSGRTLVDDYQKLYDWKTETIDSAWETFFTATRYDALDRPVAVTTPDKSIIQPGYNEANLLERLDVNLRGAETATPFVTDIDYNAKGQRVRIEYGNDVKTDYSYDPETLRLTRLTTTRRGFAQDERVVQDLSYIYDPSGNITHIQDDADLQDVIFFRNKRVEPSSDYTYDAIYRLIEAIGREHLGQAGGDSWTPTPTSYNDQPRVGLLQPGDGNAMGRYTQQYQYDAVGNILEMSHRGTDPASPGWTRAYAYSDPSLLEPGKTGNRLTRITLSPNGSQPQKEAYAHDAHGNMTAMPQLQVMRWDFKDRLLMTQRQAVNSDDTDGTQHQGEQTYYVYDATGQRVRKVTQRQNGTPRNERIYLGGFEVFREYDGTGKSVSLERETLHVMDEKQRVALVEGLTRGDDRSQLMRYQFSNHLGSACLELNDQAKVISYEEYYPYGSTSYQAVDKAIMPVAKRYRYTGKERDEETGLNYHGARYCAAWLGRWISCDPAGIMDSANSYIFTIDNPILLVDQHGTDSSDPSLISATVSRKIEQDFRGGESSVTISASVRINIPFFPFTIRTSERTILGEVEQGERSQHSHKQTPEPPEERSFWSRGGAGLVLGGVATVIGGFIIFSNPVGWAVALAGAMLFAGGVATTAASGIELGASYSGMTTKAQDVAMNKAVGTALSLSSPGGLTGGTTGLIIGGESGLEKGAFIGGLAEGAISLGTGVYRLRPGPGLFPAPAGEVTLAEWRALNAAQRTAYEVGQQTVSDLLHLKLQALSPIARGEALLSSGVGRTIVAARPWKLIKTWATGLTPGARLVGPSFADALHLGLDPMMYLHLQFQNLEEGNRR